MSRHPARIHRQPVRQSILFGLVASVFMASAFTAALGQELKANVNALPLPVNIITDTVLSTSAQLADELRSILNDSPDVRLRPLIGDGDVANLHEFMTSDPVDLALVQLDALNYFLDVGLFEGIENKLNYVSTMHAEELHILARSSLTRFDDLNGKRVNVGPSIGGTYLTAAALFDLHEVDIFELRHPHFKALSLLKAREIDAMVVVDGKPSSFLRRASLDDGIRLLSVPGNPLAQNHRPTTINSTDYPNLLATGDEITTIQVPTALIAYNWPEGSAGRRALDSFIQPFLAALATLRSASNSAYHPKWREIDLWSPAPGVWKRDPASLRHLNPLKRFDAE